MNPIATLQLLRDLTHRMPLDPGLVARIKALADKPLAPLTGSAAKDFVEEAITLATDCLAHLDAEMKRLTEAKFSAPDPNTLKQRLLADPRRQADQIVNSIKQRFGNEKQEWVRRVAKQLNDVQTGLDQQHDSLEVKEVPKGASVVLVPEPEWLRAYDAWRGESYSRWGAHLTSVLPGKMRKAIEGDIQILSQLLGKPVAPPEHPASPFRPPAGRDNAKEFLERFDVPTAFEAFFDSFKERLNTVAMIAGLVVIPVIGSLMHTASTEIRAAVMGSTLVPVIAFSVFQGRKHRKKLHSGNHERAKSALKKQLAQETKNELDRFKLDAERYTAAYCSAAQQAVGTSLEQEVARHFEALEKQVATDLAAAQLEADRLMDQLGVARQLKGSLSSQLLLDLRRRLAELTEAPAA
jgi:hypothetical protein